MDNKKKFLLIIIISILIITIGDFLICNLKVFGHIKEETVFNNTSITTDDSYKEYSINLDNQYIKKLYINYQSNKQYEIKYIVNGKETLDTCTEFIDVEVLNINKKANNIKLIIPDDVNINDIKIVNKITFNKTIYVLMITILFTIVSILMVYKYGITKLPLLFFIMFFGFGSVFIISCAPVTGGSWDDYTHYYGIIRTVHFNKFKISKAEETNVNTSYRFPYYNTEEEIEAIENYLDSIDKQDIDQTKRFPVNEYSLSYLPSSIVYNTLRLLNVKYSLRIKLTQLFQIILYALIIAYAIKIIPKYKLLMFVISLIPTSLFVASHFNYDAILLSCVLLGIAFFIKMINDKHINNKDYIICMLCLTLGVFNKAIYVPLVLLPLMIPNKKFKDVKTSKKLKIATILLLVAIMASFVIPTLVASPTEVADTRVHTNTSVGGQISFIIHNPITFGNIFIRNAGYQFFDKFIGMGTIILLGYYGSPTGSYLYYIFLIVLLLSFLKACDDGEVLNKKYKIIIGIIVLLIVCFIWGAMYLSYNDVGATVIDGVQGRYFIPLLMPLLLVFITNKIKFNVDEKNIAIISSSIIMFIYFMIIIGLFLPYNL